MNGDFDQAWRQLQEWAEELPPGLQAALQGAGILTAAYVAGRILGAWAGRRLRAHNFDGAVRLPGSPGPAAGASGTRGWTPTGLAVLLMRLTVWGAGVWYLAYMHGWTDLAQGLERFAGRFWTLAVLFAVALGLGGVVAAKLIDVVQRSAWKEKLEEWLPPADGRERRSSPVALLAGLMVDGLAVLLVLLVAADVMGWTFTGNAVTALWRLGLHLFTAGAALVIGGFGVRWARAQASADVAPGAAPSSASGYAALAIVGASTVLAILLLAGSQQEDGEHGAPGAARVVGLAGRPVPAGPVGGRAAAGAAGEGGPVRRRPPPPGCRGAAADTLGRPQGGAS